MKPPCHHDWTRMIRMIVIILNQQIHDMRVSVNGPPNHPFNRVFPHKPPHMLGYLHIFPHVWGQKSGVIGETRLSCLGDRPKLPFVVLVQQLLATGGWIWMSCRIAK